MTKLLLAAAAAFMIATAPGAYAAGSQTGNGSNVIIDSNNQVALRFIGTYLDYSEYGGDYGTPTGLLDTERGWVPGVGIKASVMKNLLLGNDYLAAEFSWNKGHTHYVGAYIGGGPYGSVVGNDGATFVDFDVKYGKGFSLQSGLMLTPYATVGYHHWDRAVNQGETYSHGYAGGGAMLQYAATDRLVLTADGMIGGTFGSHINVAGPTGFSAALGNSMTYKLGLSADYALTRQLHMSAGVDYTDFKYGASALQPSLYYEPHSTSHVTTFNIGIGYAF